MPIITMIRKSKYVMCVLRMEHVYVPGPPNDPNERVTSWYNMVERFLLFLGTFESSASNLDTHIDSYSFFSLKSKQ